MAKFGQFWLARYGGSLFGGFGGYRYPPRPRYQSFSNLLTDKSKFEDGRIWNPPLRNNGNFIDSAFFPPKEKWAPKRSDHRRRSLPSANTGRAPSGMGPAMFAPSQWGIKNLFQKGFCGAFSLKKRPLRPQAPPGKSKFEALPLKIPAKITYKLVGTGVLDCPRTNG